MDLTSKQVVSVSPVYDFYVRSFIINTLVQPRVIMAITSSSSIDANFFQYVHIDTRYSPPRSITPYTILQSNLLFVIPNHCIIF